MNEKQNKRHAELLEVLVLLVDGGLRNAVPSAESRRTASREVAQNVLEFLADKLLVDESRTSQLPAMSIAEFRAHLAQCVAEVADWPDWKRNQLRSGDSK